MQNLQVLIDHLEKRRNLHISILDFSGILTAPLTKIRFDHMIHSKKFCDIAKSTSLGYKACIRCKAIANSKAIDKRSSFCGQCIYGLYEAAFPVIIERSVMAIVYVGNAIIDEDLAKKRIIRTCDHTGVSPNDLLSQLEYCERIESADELIEIAEIVADYLKMLFENAPVLKEEKHWIIPLMKRYAKENTSRTISLREFAVSHQKNAQYIGRIFKKEVGMSFNQYCNNVRFDKALKMLNDGSTVTEVAEMLNYTSIYTFSRAFRNKFGVSPTHYQKKHMPITVNKSFFC